MAKNGQQAARADVGGQRLPDAPKAKQATLSKRTAAKAGSGGGTANADPGKADSGEKRK